MTKPPEVSSEVPSMCLLNQRPRLAIPRLGLANGAVIALLVSCTLGVFGCNSLKQEPHDQSVWVFQAVRQSFEAAVVSGPSASSSTTALGVERVQVQTPYSDSAIVYRTSPQALKHDPYRRYAAKPTDLLTHQLVTWLQAARIADLVQPSASADPSSPRLRLSVTELVLDHSGSSPVAKIIARGLVLKNTTDGVDVLLDKPYQSQAVIELSGKQNQAAMEASMAAMSEAVADLYASLEDDVLAALAE